MDNELLLTYGEELIHDLRAWIDYLRPNRKYTIRKIRSLIRKLSRKIEDCKSSDGSNDELFIELNELYEEGAELIVAVELNFKS